MLPTEIRDLEGQLLEVYGRQSQLYAEFLRLAETLPTRITGEDAGEERLRQMNETMAQIHQLDIQIGPTRQAWQALGIKATGPLADRLKEVERLIVAVMDKLERAEVEATAAKERLLPQLSTESKRMQMTRAYRAVSDSR